MLSEVGLREAERIGAYMREHGFLPKRVLCSPARRAAETLEALGNFLPINPEVHLEEKLYMASSRELMERLRGLEPHCSSVLVVAHNPGLGELAHALGQSKTGNPDANQGNPDATARLGHGFPPAAFAAFRLSATAWNALSPTTSYLEAFTRPRQLEK